MSSNQPMKKNHKDILALQVIDTWLDYHARYSQLPGFQVCIRKNHELLFSKAYGYANLKTKRALTKKDLFHIASHSKTFTSCAVLRLIEQGLLGFEHRAIEYIPELKKHKDKRYQHITVRDLLSNRSGIFRDGVQSDFWQLMEPFPNRERLLQELLSSSLTYDPNTCTKYSNIGFSLLGLIIENVLGKPYAQAIDSLIFKKLKGTQILTDYSATEKSSFADGHTRALFEGERAPLKHAPALALAPATGFCANAEDTSLFFDKLLLGKGLLTPQLQQELLSLHWPVKNSPQDRYGLGVHFDKFSRGELIGHSGGYPGFTTYTSNWVGTGYIVSFFLNTNERISLSAASGLLEIIDKINLTFTNAEAKEAILSAPLMNKWESLIFIITKKKGLGFILDSWEPCKGAILLRAHKKGRDYVCEQQSGYLSAGELISIDQDKAGKILGVKWGSHYVPSEKTFLKNIEKTLE